MIELTYQFARYGYRRVAALLRDAAWQVNDKRVERLWKRKGLKVPMKQAKRGRLWLNPFWDIAAQCPVGRWMVPIFGSWNKRILLLELLNDMKNYSSYQTNISEAGPK